MWGWVVSAVVALLGVGAVAYYRSRGSDARVNELLTANTEILKEVNALLQALADRAKAAQEQDKKEATNVHTAKEASDFLNASSSRVQFNPYAREGSPAHVRPPRRPAPSPFINGFARGPGYVVERGSGEPGAVDEGRSAMARSRFGLYEEWC